MDKRKRYVISLRNFRTWHRMLGLFIALFLVISSVTGILLAWKKNSDLIQPPTQKGASKDLSTWLPVDSLALIADRGFSAAFPNVENNGIDRMDIRPSKGIVKVLMENGFWEVQLDGTTGEILSIARRHSDWIEALHDGSIISDAFKFVSMNFLGIAILFMIISGTWMWYGPKLVRKLRK